MDFTLLGRKFSLIPEDILKSMRGIQPEIVRTHAVELDGKLYPVKQVLSVATGLAKADFNSHQARQVLRRIGFQVVVVSETANKY